eukprot:gene1025-2011_t
MVQLDMVHSTLLSFLISMFPAYTEGIWPEIYLIGAQKSGTTSLHELLESHRQICKSTCLRGVDCLSVKELHFFDNDVRFASGPKGYVDDFDKRRCTGKFIDGTPDYFHSEAVPKRMESMIPSKVLKKLKIILILREPISRDYSFFQHLLRGCLDDKNRNCEQRHCKAVLRKCLSKHEDKNNTKFINYDEFVDLRWSTDSSLYRGFYVNNIENFLTVFDRKQMFIASFDQLVYNTSGLMNRMAVFLELEKGFGNKVKLPKKNTNEGVDADPMSCKVKAKLMKFYENENQKLYEFLDKTKTKYEPRFRRFKDILVECIL